MDLDTDGDDTRAVVDSGGTVTSDADETIAYEFGSSRELDKRARQLVSEEHIVTRLVSTTRADSLKISGPCARCDDPFTQTQVLQLPVTTVRGWNLNRPARDDRYADYLCECSVAHPGTPPGATGCGASYAVVSEGSTRG